MASDLNKTILIGRLTKDPELKHTPSGTSVASFSVAVNHSYGSGEDKKETVLFINCVSWAKGGELIAQYVRKGHRIALEGRLQSRSWESSDGSKRSAVELVVDNFQFLQPKGDLEADKHPEFKDLENPFSDSDIIF